MPKKTKTTPGLRLVTKRALRYLRRVRRRYKLGNDGAPAGREAQHHRALKRRTP